MKGKFLRKAGRRIALLLVASLVFTTNGVTTLASGLQEQASEAAYSEDAETAVTEDSEEILFDDGIVEEEEILTAGTIDWNIDSDGVLTVSGTGNLYGTTGSTNENAWPWYTAGRQTEIKSAKVQISGDTTDLSYMFYGCTALQSVSFEGSDTSKVTSMMAMFRGCTNLEKIDFSGVNTSAVTKMMYMFCDCSSLQVLDLSGFDTSNVMYMGAMFYGCRKLSTLNLTGFNMKSVTSMSEMFYNCTDLVSIVGTEVFSGAHPNDLSAMFAGCSSLTGIDLSGLDTSAVEDMSTMFENCTALQSLNLSSFNLSSCTDAPNMLSGCTSLAGVNTPLGLKVSVTLPAVMTDGNQTYNALPQNATTSTYIYKNTSTTAAKTYTISLKAGANGSIKAVASSIGTQEIAAGTSQQVTLNGIDSLTLTFNPATNFTVDYVKVGGETVTLEAYNTYVIKDVSKVTSVEVSFKAGDNTQKSYYEIKLYKKYNATVSVNGTAISETKSVKVQEGNSATVTVTPNSGNVLKEIKDSDGNSYGSASSFTISNVKKDISLVITVETAAETTTYELSGLKADGATISAYYIDTNNTDITITDGTATVTMNKKFAVTVTAKEDYMLKSVTYGNGTAFSSMTSSSASNVFSDGISSATSFAITTAAAVSVKVEETVNGTVKVNGSKCSGTTVKVLKGDAIAIGVEPAENYKIGEVKVTASSTGQVTTYTDTSFTLSGNDSYTISATFEKLEYTVTFQTVGVGATVTVGDKTYAQGDTITVTPGDSLTLAIEVEDGKWINSITAGEDVSLTDVGESRTVYLKNISKNIDVIIGTRDKLATDTEKATSYTVSFVVPENSVFAYYKDSKAVQINDGDKITVGADESVDIYIRAKYAYSLTAITIGDKNVLGDCSPGTIGSATYQVYPVANLSGDITISATVVALSEVPCTVTLDYDASLGTVSIKDQTLTDNTLTVKKGDITVEVKPKSGYVVKSVTVGSDSKNVDADGGSFTVTISADTKISVVFAEETKHNVTVTTEGNGSVSADPALTNGIASVGDGKSITLTIAPDDNYELSAIYVGTQEQKNIGTNFTLSNVTAEATIKVVFKEKAKDAVYHTVGIKDTENGSITANWTLLTGDKTISVSGKDVTVKKYFEIKDTLNAVFTFKPDEGYLLDTVKVNDKVQTVTDNELIVENVTSDLVIEAVFKVDPDAGSEEGSDGEKAEAYSIELKIGQNGTVSSDRAISDNKITVSANEAVKFTVSANTGYQIKTVTVDGAELDLTSLKDRSAYTYEDKKVTANHKVEVTFESKVSTVSLTVNGEAYADLTIDQATGKLTCSQNLVLSGDKQPYLGAVFGGWYTAADGKGTQVVDCTGQIVSLEAVNALSTDDTLYAYWERLVLIDKQKMDVSSYFADELNAYLAANPKGKYKYVVYTDSPVYSASKAAAGSANKLASVTKKGILTAKKAGNVKVVLATYDLESKKYVDGKTVLYLTVEKIAVKKVAMTHKGEKASLDDYLTYGFAETAGYGPNNSALTVKFTSSKPEVVAVNESTGALEAKATGTAKIKAVYTYKAGGKDYKITKTVTVSVKTPKLKFSKVTIKAGKNKTNSVVPASDLKEVVWSSSDPSSVSVDAASGQINGLRAGSHATVTAKITYKDGMSEVLTCEVVVK